MRALTDSAVEEWYGDGATILNLVDGSTQRLDFDALILSTPNASEATLQHDLADSSLEVHAIGDCVAPRLAALATYEGRRLALSL